MQLVEIQIILALIACIFFKLYNHGIAEVF